MSNSKVSPLVDAVNEFTFRLQRHNRGLALCGLNLFEGLLLTTHMYDGRSREELLNAIGISYAYKQEVMGTLRALLDGIKRDGRVKSSSSLWCRLGLKLEPSVTTPLVEQLQTKIASLDEDAVNAYVHASTDGKITTNFAVDDDVALMLVSCLYFKAEWRTPFDDSTTVDSVFHSFTGASEQCRMMTGESTWPFYKDEQLRALIMPYEWPTNDSPDSPKWAALFLLPNGAGVSALQKSIDTVTSDSRAWRDFLSSFGDHSVEASIPRFQMRRESDVCAALRGLGVEGVFNQSVLDFCAATPPREPAWISRISHTTHLECNEQGTEMAAVTQIEEEDGLADEKFVADRPFWFMLFDMKSALVLYSAMVEHVGEDVMGDS